MQVHENNAPSEIILTHCGISMYAKCFIAWGGIATLTLATVSKIGHFLDNNATSHIKCNVLIGICTYNIHFINDTIAISDHYLTHCLDLDLNGLLTRRNFWRIPGMLGNYTIPKWKEFLKSREPILRKSYLSTFIHINKHMDRARGTLW